MTTPNQNQQATNPNPADNTPPNPDAGDPTKQTGNGAPGDGAGATPPANGNDPAAQAAVEKAAADKAAADKAVADKAVADKAAADNKAAAKQQMDAAIASWQTAVKSDPDLGGDKYDATVIDFDAGVKAIGSEGLAKLLDSTGLRHQPDVVRAFAKAGRLVKEGKITVGAAPQAKPKTIADVLYNNTK